MIFRKLVFFFSLSILFTAWAGCTKNMSAEGDPLPNGSRVDPVNSPPPTPGRKIPAQLEGELYIQSGDPAVGQPFGIQGIYPNAPQLWYNIAGPKGRFTVKEPALNEDATVITINNPGTIPTSFPLIIQKDRQHFTKKRLWERTAGMIVTASGLGQDRLIRHSPVEMLYPAGTWINTESKQLWTGDFQYVWAYIQAIYESVGEEQPGDLRGINAKGEKVVLTPHHMSNVTLLDGQDKIGLAPGKTVTISAFIYDMLWGPLPATSTAWYYDLETALWKEAGPAVMQGDRYVYQVPQIGWSCVADASPQAFVHMQFLDESNNPLKFHSVDFMQENKQRPDRQWLHRAYTNSTGEVRAYVPQNKKCIVILRNQCGQELYTAPLGPLSQGHWETVKVNLAAKLHNFEGQALDCDGKPVKNGEISVETNGVTNKFPVKDGKFAFGIPICNIYSNVNLKVTDLTSGSSSAYVTFTPIPGGKTVVPAISVCAEKDKLVKGTIIFTVDGQTYTIDGSKEEVAIKQFIDPASGKWTTALVTVTTPRGLLLYATYGSLSAGSHPLYLFRAATPAMGYLMTWGFYEKGTIEVDQLDFSKGIMKGRLRTKVSRSDQGMDKFVELTATFDVTGK